MNAPVSALEGVSVVVAGQFNAAIFSPAWLASQELIGPAELAAAEIEIITRELAVFAAGWLQIQVTPEALRVGTSDLDEYDRVRDAASGILRALSHTPVSAVGINHDAHFQVPDVESWHLIGDAITPKDAWADALHLPGMRSAKLWGARDDGYAGHVQVTVEPSLRIGRSVYCGVNDHFSLRRVEHIVLSREDPNFLSAEAEESMEPHARYIPEVLSVLADQWKTCEVRARKIYKTVIAIGAAA